MSTAYDMMTINFVMSKFNSFTPFASLPLASKYTSNKMDRIAHRKAVLVLSRRPGQAAYCGGQGCFSSASALLASKIFKPLNQRLQNFHVCVPKVANVT
jgi:hypothetical protein